LGSGWFGSKRDLRRSVGRAGRGCGRGKEARFEKGENAWQRDVEGFEKWTRGGGRPSHTGEKRAEKQIKKEGIKSATEIWGVHSVRPHMDRIKDKCWGGGPKKGTKNHELICSNLHTRKNVSGESRKKKKKKKKKGITAASQRKSILGESSLNQKSCLTGTTTPKKRPPDQPKKIPNPTGLTWSGREACGKGGLNTRRKLGGRGVTQMENESIYS